MGKRPAPSCYESAIGFLSRRPHFRRQLEEKLSRRFTADEVAQVVSRLSEEGLLDDLACARTMADGPLRRKGYGPRRVRHDLARRGASSEVVDRVVAEAFPDGDQALAAEVAAKWRAGRDGDAAALARHLERKGFTAGAIRRAVHEPSAEPGGTC